MCLRYPGRFGGAGHSNKTYVKGVSLMALTREQQIAALEKDWAENPRWKNVTRTYSAADVVRLRGSVQPEHTFARNGAEKL